MGPSPRFTLASPQAAANSKERSDQFVGRVYQTLTVAAMLWLLGSLWLFW